MSKIYCVKYASDFMIFLLLINYNYFNDKYGWRKPSLDFRLRKVDATRNYFTEEIKQNDLMSKNNK